MLEPEVLVLKIGCRRSNQYRQTQEEPQKANITSKTREKLGNQANIRLQKCCPEFKIPDEEPDFDDHSNSMEVAWDDVSGKHLDPGGVRKARTDEIDYYRKMGVYIKVPIAECIAKTGQRPIGVRWVDTDKGDRDRPNYRSRLVAKQYRQERDDDLYAATPPH